MSGRSEHLTTYGLVGVAAHLVVGVLIVASFRVISSGWVVTLTAAIVLSGVWMTVFFGSR